jgi:Copper transport outer membrane protein, MctB
MISMRYHIVSLAAVFLALALGIVLGATKISSPLLTGLEGDNAELSANHDQLSSQNGELADRVTGDARYAEVTGPLTVRGTLPGTNVVLITTADADPADRDAVLSLLNRAGASVTAQLQLTEAFTDPIRADELRSLAAQTLPTGVTLPEVQQVGAVAGGLLGAVLVAGADGAVVSTPEQSAAALAAFTSGGFIAVTGTPAAGRSVIMLTGGEVTGSSAGDRAAVLSDLATELKKSAAGVVAAGRSGSAGEVGVVGVIRNDTIASAAVSTVDNVDSAAGRTATVLALVEQNGGGVGRYGFADSAQAQAPTLAVG